MITYLHNTTPITLQGMQVGVYFNLSRRCYSLKAMEGVDKGLVIAYISLDHFFKLTNVIFKVRDAGRDRVRLEQQKNVHAYIIGNYSEMLFKERDEVCESAYDEITYNPYIDLTFVRSADRQGVTASQEVLFTNGKILSLKS